MKATKNLENEDNCKDRKGKKVFKIVKLWERFFTKYLQSIWH